MQASRPQAVRSTSRCHAYQLSLDELKAKAGVGQPQLVSRTAQTTSLYSEPLTGRGEQASPQEYLPHRISICVRCKPQL
jgi:hypothetical protein